MLTKVQSFMLYALGTCYAQLERRFAGKPLAIVMSKADFIDLVHSARIASKKDRAVYRNLEALERLRLIAYRNRTLSLTRKGRLEYERIRRDLAPYLFVRDLLHSHDVLRYSAKKQTVLREE